MASATEPTTSRRIVQRLQTVAGVAALAVLVACAPGPDPATDPEATAPPVEGTPAPAEPPIVDTEYAVGDPVDDETALGRLCGSRGLAPCPDDMFCDFPDGSDCGSTDRGGRCELRPQMCTKQYDPVCSCRGETFGNLCMAHAAGVDADRKGPCPGDADGG